MHLQQLHRWHSSCLITNVLRITIPKRGEPQVFVLQGRLGGEWVHELLSVTRGLAPATDTVFDIEDVLFVDALGERALHWLNQLGARFVAHNPYCVDLCNRLQLRRMMSGDELTTGRSDRRTEGGSVTSSLQDRERPGDIADRARRSTSPAKAKPDK